MTALLWLRRELRVHDHPALVAAASGAAHLVPVFCLDDRLLAGRHASGPRTQFLLQSLEDLDRSLRRRGSRLVVLRGIPERVLPSLARQLGAGRLHFSADVSPFARARDSAVAAALGRAGIEVNVHPGPFVADDLGAIRTTAGAPYTVFTPFLRAWDRLARRRVLEAPGRLPPLPGGLDSGWPPQLSELGPADRVPSPVPGGETAGRRRMAAFLSAPTATYAERRDLVAHEATSMLSPYLHLGCVSARELESRLGDADAVRRQLCWRDFYAHVLLHFPCDARAEHQARYRGRLRYGRSRTLFDAWCEGRTGYPLVDAGMRQLRCEGWMHNRARMVVGSFLTKDLGLDWRWGEAWFMRWLLDGDEASNNGNWQWIASVGVDPQPPSRRMFNPSRQQQRFDPEGAYVRRYVPELRGVPAAHLVEPWTMPAAVQRSSGCVLGREYPLPLVDHAVARDEALRRYAMA